jgi:hypothetical protein
VHLAELLLSGNPKDALLHYQTAAESEDPEPQGKLAAFFADEDRSLSLVYRDEATSRYEGLLARFPLAFADHGAEYFLGAGGDPARGLSLALMNLENRKTPRAYLVAIGAAEENDDRELLCDLVRDAEPFAAVHPVLAEVLEGNAKVCGD